jgi:hypothetical protein
MPDYRGATPQQIAALDQFGAAFRPACTEFRANAQTMTDALVGMTEAFRSLHTELLIAGLQQAMEDGDTMAAHPDLAQVERHLDGFYGDDDA